MTDHATRTGHLLALMKKGDDAFNARDFAAVDTVHHPDMVAYIPGNAQPIYGSVAHAAAMQQMLRIFPDLHVYTPYPIQFWQWRLDHRDHPRHRDVPRADGPAQRQSDRADRQSIRRGIRPNHEVGRRSAHHHLGLFGCCSASATDRPKPIERRAERG
jgi:SnoaL-like polyketide cyclase